MSDLLSELPPISALPANASDFEKIVHDHTQFKIPIPAITLRMLHSELDYWRLSRFIPVPGNHKITMAFALLLQTAPIDYNSELTTTIAVANLLSTVFRYMNIFSDLDLRIDFHLDINKTQAGVQSSGTTSVPSRPSMLLVDRRCTLMVGQHKGVGSLREALSDLGHCTKGGLNAQHYGKIPGIPAYAASGLQLTFCFVHRFGQVHSSSDVLDLSTLKGRLDALCCSINVYRILARIASGLPSWVYRKPLWISQSRFHGEIMLTPQGAFKNIYSFKAFAREAGTSQQAVEAAYQVAAVAAADCRRNGELPYLVSAVSGPSFSRGAFSVQTRPLGFDKELDTETDVRQMALACCRAAAVLHKVDIVHSDLRKSNVVWLAPDHCMVIDLEHCRRLSDPLPQTWLADWEDDTMDQDAGGNQVYTKRSDMYQICAMVRKALQAVPRPHSQAANAFVNALLEKRLDAEGALSHEWLKLQQQE